MALLSFLLLSLSLLSNTVLARYEPTWESIDSRPLPSWYDEAKFGIFMHWGVFSVPSYGDEWFWWYWKGAKVQQYVDFMKKNYRPDFTYADFAAEFTAEFYDPNQWADLLKASGAKYVVLTTKHHEGFDNWPSNYSFNWNSMDVGPKRDLVGDLARALRNRTDIHFGVYHSMFEWFNPLYLADKAAGFQTKKFVNGKTIPELYELVNNYRPEVIWSDGSGSAPYTYWGSTEFLAWLYNDSPVKDTVVVNDRWGANMSCKHGGYYTCHDRYNPGKVINHKWENCMTIDRKSWGYRREAVLADYLTMDELTQVLAETISCGGNLLMNVGPTHDGRIVPIFEERLRQMGKWLEVNGEAIYKSQPWQHQNDTFTKGVWYTSQQSSDGIFVYAIVLDWPTGGVLQLESVTPQTDTKVTLLGYSGGPLKWATSGTTISIRFPDKDKVNSDWAWVVRFEGL